LVLNILDLFLPCCDAFAELFGVAQAFVVALVDELRLFAFD
jgi:hypothetical protein